MTLPPAEITWLVNKYLYPALHALVELKQELIKRKIILVPLDVDLEFVVAALLGFEYDILRPPFPGTSIPQEDEYFNLVLRGEFQKNPLIPKPSATFVIEIYNKTNKLE